MTQGALIAVRKLPSLSVDVSELLRRPGASESVQIDRVLSGVEVPLARVRDDSVLHVDVRLESLVDGIHVSGTVRGAAGVECRRCLKDLDVPLDVDLDEVFLYPGDAGDGDAYAVTGKEIDLEPAVRDAVMLALPLNPLCTETCRGLCSTCGADLNETDCGHSQDPVDIRWTGLEQLRRTLEE
jgi:uncharacterized protein